MIETQRLRCEPVTTAHADVMFPVLIDEQIYKYLPEQPPVSVDELRRRYTFLSKGESPDGEEKWLNWMLFDRETGQPVGFYQATVRRDTCSIAYVLNSKFWHNGYACEAGLAIIAHLFDRYDVSAISAEIDERNLRSIELAKRLGMKFIRRDTNAGDDIFAISQSEWVAARSRAEVTEPPRPSR